MKKKTKKRLKWLLVLLVVAAFVSLWTVPPKVKTPKMVWRVPVKLAMPELPQMPELSVLPKIPSLDQAGDALEDIKDQTLAFEEKLMLEPPVETSPVIGEGRVEPPRQQQPSPHKETSTPHLPPPVMFPDNRPRIAIVIDDMGLVRGLSQRALRLPPFVTLSFLPYAPNVQEQVDAAKNKGHDILLHLPMEPMGRANPGPDAMMVGQGEEAWQRIIMKNISAFDGFVGVNNHMGSRFTMDASGMAVVSEALLEEGLFFLDSRTNPRSLAEGTMRAHGVKTAARDIFLDDTQTPAAIRAELEKLESLARRRGSAIAIGHPHAVTLEALESWLPLAQARGVVFVPVRQMVR